MTTVADGTYQARVSAVPCGSPHDAGMRVVNPGWAWWPSWLDVYHNLRLVPKIKAPVLVMHVRALPH